MLDCVVACTFTHCFVLAAGLLIAHQVEERNRRGWTCTQPEGPMVLYGEGGGAFCTWGCCHHTVDGSFFFLLHTASTGAERSPWVAANTGGPVEAKRGDGGSRWADGRW